MFHKPVFTHSMLRSPRAMREAPGLDESVPAGPPRLKYVLLVNPFYPKDPHGSFGKHVLTPSLALTTLAGATPPDWLVRLWDENLLQGLPPCRPVPALVGITVHLTFARRAYELSEWYRQRGAKVVLGGPHVTACPEEAAEHADAIAIGEGAQVWPEILRDAETGRLRKRYAGSYDAPYDACPPVRRDLLSKRDFATVASLIATRGCRNRCDFCYLSTRGLKMPYQVRSVDSVVREFLSTGEPYAVFTDNNLGADKDYLRALCGALRPAAKIWSAAVTIDVTDDPDLVREMALAGCTGVFVGFESLTAENLTDAGKRTPLPEEYARRVEVFHRNGIQVNGSFVLGFDHDRPDVFERTVEWIEQNRLSCATFHILTPYPSTPLFRQMEKEDRLLHRDWDRYDTAHCVFRPRHMTPEELEKGYAWCYRRLFSMDSIWQRRPYRWGEVPGYLAMMLLYKKINFLWPLLIRWRLTHALWSPFVTAARWRHLRYRRRLALQKEIPPCLIPIVPGV